MFLKPFKARLSEGPKGLICKLCSKLTWPWGIQRSQPKQESYTIKLPENLKEAWTARLSLPSFCLLSLNATLEMFFFILQRTKFKDSAMPCPSLKGQGDSFRRNYLATPQTVFLAFCSAFSFYYHSWRAASVPEYHHCQIHLQNYIVLSWLHKLLQECCP